MGHRAGTGFAGYGCRPRGPAGPEPAPAMFDLVAVWFVIGMFVAGCWIVVGSLLPRPPGR